MTILSRVVAVGILLLTSTLAGCATPNSDRQAEEGEEMTPGEYQERVTNYTSDTKDAVERLTQISIRLNAGDLQTRGGAMEASEITSRLRDLHALANRTPVPEGVDSNPLDRLRVELPDAIEAAKLVNRCLEQGAVAACQSASNLVAGLDHLAGEETPLFQAPVALYPQGVATVAEQLSTSLRNTGNAFVHTVHGDWAPVRGQNVLEEESDAVGDAKSLFEYMETPGSGWRSVNGALEDAFRDLGTAQSQIGLCFGGLEEGSEFACGDANDDLVEAIHSFDKAMFQASQLSDRPQFSGIGTKGSGCGITPEYGGVACNFVTVENDSGEELSVTLEYERRWVYCSDPCRDTLFPNWQISDGQRAPVPYGKVRCLGASPYNPTVVNVTLRVETEEGSTTELEEQIPCDSSTGWNYTTFRVTESLEIDTSEESRDCSGTGSYWVCDGEEVS